VLLAAEVRGEGAGVVVVGVARLAAAAPGSEGSATGRSAAMMQGVVAVQSAAARREFGRHAVCGKCAVRCQRA